MKVNFSRILFLLKTSSDTIFFGWDKKFWRKPVKIIESNVRSIKRRPLTEEDFKYVLQWSKDVPFCSANGWEKNRDEQELYRWWLNCVNNVSEDFIRLGIELIIRKANEGDIAFQKMIEEGHLEHYQKDIEFIRVHGKEWG
jgi:hypothetical protein